MKKSFLPTTVRGGIGYVLVGLFFAWISNGYLVFAPFYLASFIAGAVGIYRGLSK